MKNSVPHHFRAKDGEVLYHYTSSEGALAILRNQIFWLSEYSKTNDSSEYLYARDKFIKFSKERNVWIDDLPRFVATTALVGSEANTVMTVGCLTKRKDDLGQWDRYADKARGCVVGIDANYLQNEAGVALRKINYRAADLRQFVNIGLSMLQRQYEEDPNDIDGLKELARFFVADLFAFKDKAFALEREIRVSRLLVADVSGTHGLKDEGGHRADGTSVAPLPIKLRVGPFGPTRYVELPLTTRSGKSAIRSIGFGPTCPDNVQSEFRDLNLALPDPAELWKSTLPYRIK